MQNNFIKIAVCIITAIVSFSVSATEREWKDAPGGLPYYKYTGSQSEDAAFLLGNPRIKVRTHQNGIYELISGDRCWGCFNADPTRPDYGKNRATAYVGRKKFELVGPGSLATQSGKCEVYSGAGFARYDYDLGNGIKCSRMISVMPSKNPQEAVPVFLVTLTFENQSTSARNISYEEAISPYYVQSAHRLTPEAERPIQYNISTEISFRCIKADFGAVPQGFVSLAIPQHRAKDEFDPHSIFIYCDNAFLVVNEGELKASIDDFRLRPRRKHTFHVVVGFSGESNRKTAEAFILKAEDGRAGAFSSMWKKHIPDFSSEQNTQIRNELYRCAYSAEALTVYSDYFKETFIPGKIGNAIRYGENTSNSEHINAALQACYTDPSLAKSIIRYVMKQTSFDGMIPDANKGYGYIPSDQYTHNLVQLEVLNAITEYLRLTGDYAFLDEWIEAYPIERGEVRSVMSVIESYFMYLSERTYVSASMSSMQAAILPEFLNQIELCGKSSAEFLTALRSYTEKSLDHFTARTDYRLSDLQYLLKAQSLTSSKKRDILDDAIDEGIVDMTSLPGIATFDTIEAKSIFRTLILQNKDAKADDREDLWTIYSYFRIKE